MNLFSDIPSDLPEELITVLAESKSVKIERIISAGHASTEGFWYDQKQNEWVLLISGSAVLELEDGETQLNPGDHLLIPAHQRHRVKSTSPTDRTIWLVVFYENAAI